MRRLHTLALHIQSHPAPFRNIHKCFPRLVSPKKPSIYVDKRVALNDEKVKILLDGFPSKAKVTLHGQMLQGQKEIIFASCGHFLTDDNGAVDVTQQSSQGGTYSGVEPMGIIWSLKPAPGQPKDIRMAINFTDRPGIITIKTYLGHLELDDIYPEQSADLKSLASIDIERWFRKSDVTRIEVEDGRVRGALFLPPGDGPFQGVIDMFGGAGGIIEYRSALLASRGFAALSLPYFFYKDLPTNLDDLCYEYFEEAIEWMCNHHKIVSDGIGVVATSKGVENALCMGAFSDKVTAVVAFNGNPFGTIGHMAYKGTTLINSVQLDISKGDFTDEEGLDLRPCIPGVAECIPIWKGRAKYLVFASLDDCQCDTSLAADYLLDSCPESKKKDIEIVRYPGAGHLLEPPYTPLCRSSFNKVFNLLLKWGGHPKEHAHAQEDAWQRTLEFLSKNIPTATRTS